MLEKQRQQLIVDILEEEQFSSVRTLCTKLKSSEATIRRDLNKMAKLSLLKKIRGGAEVNNKSKLKSKRPQIQSSLFLVDKETNLDKKQLIAKKAVEMCEDNESIIINGGSSTYMMGQYLMDRQLNILTNSIVLAQTLWEESDNQVTLPGGEIYRSQGIILSAFDNDSIPNYHCSKMFMGTPAINSIGVMESDTLLVRAEHKLKKQAEKLIIMADSSKLGGSSNFLFVPLAEVDILITDSDADPKIIKEFEAQGIEVIIAD
ncbi:MAG: DeoR/GlpR transcriptional regulator [Colwellia sp.]|nr:DeoR/GlpR transcriptional regulator [Colwellia sp.]